MVHWKVRNRRRNAWRISSTFPNAIFSVRFAKLWPKHIVGKARKSRIKKALWHCERNSRSMEIKLFTIGFTQKSAREFFAALKEAGVKRVVDVRLNNNSQLAGFSKKEDLPYFLKKIGNIDYIHAPDLAPTQEILDAFKKRKGD